MSWQQTDTKALVIKSLEQNVRTEDPFGPCKPGLPERPGGPRAPGNPGDPLGPASPQIQRNIIKVNEYICEIIEKFTE